jgi:hypothetical protein
LTYQVLADAHDVNLLGDNIGNINKRTGTRENYVYKLLPRHQHAGQYQDTKIANRLFEKVSMFKYFGTTVPSRSLIQEEIERSLHSGNACYHFVYLLVCYLKTLKS